MRFLYIILFLIFMGYVNGFVVQFRQQKISSKAPGLIGISGSKTKRLVDCSRYNVFESQLYSQQPSQSITSQIIFPSRLSTLSLRWITGLSLAALGSIWIGSNKHIFLVGLLLIYYVAQRELSQMIGSGNVQQPILSKICSVLSCVTFFAAAYFPEIHNIIYPISIAVLIAWLFACGKEPLTLKQVSLNSFSVLYLALMPSYWIRLHGIVGGSKFSFNPYSWSLGQKLTWLTIATIVFSDVGAFFVGKSLGRNKLGVLSAAAGAASPNKTIEGAVGGAVAAAICSSIGAKILGLENWALAGTVYGLLLAVFGLIGDLTASFIKREAKLKDSGNILPGHGGILDRMDSYILNAPIAFLLCNLLLGMY